MSEVSVNVSRDLTDVPKASSIRITLASSADLGQYESAMHELAYSIGMTMLMENKNFLYIADVGSETIEDFKAVTRQKEKARKPGIADASLEKIIAGKLQHFLSDQAVESSTLLLGLKDPVWCEMPEDASVRDVLSGASRLVGADVIATLSRTTLPNE
jgi:translation elongation factor EF-Ts